jgi:hypothetical protein
MFNNMDAYPLSIKATIDESLLYSHGIGLERTLELVPSLDSLFPHTT